MQRKGDEAKCIGNDKIMDGLAALPGESRLGKCVRELKIGPTAEAGQGPETIAPGANQEVTAEDEVRVNSSPQCKSSIRVCTPDC